MNDSSQEATIHFTIETWDGKRIVEHQIPTVLAHVGIPPIACYSLRDLTEEVKRRGYLSLAAFSSDELLSELKRRIS